MNAVMDLKANHLDALSSKERFETVAKRDVLNGETTVIPAKAHCCPEYFSTTSSVAVSDPKSTKETRHSREGGNPASPFALSPYLRGGDDGFWDVAQRSNIHPSATAALDSRLRGNDGGFELAISRLANFPKACHALSPMAPRYSGQQCEGGNPVRPLRQEAFARGHRSCSGNVQVISRSFLFPSITPTTP